jgi:hypothetical protein
MVDVHRTCDRVIPLSEASKIIKSDPIIDTLSEEIENLISMSEQLLKNGDDNIEEMPVSTQCCGFSLYIVSKTRIT